MSQQTKHLVVQIGTRKDKAVLSKSQKEFNRLIRKIETLTSELTNLREATLHIQQRVQTDYRPLLEQYSQFRADLVRLFDRAYQHKDCSKTEKKKLADLIRNIAFELIDTYGITDLKPIYDKYDADGFDNTNAESDQLTAELMKEMMATMFGIEIDPDADVSDPQKMNAYVQEKIAQREAAEAERRQQTATKKPKSAKQQEREDKKQVEARNITKAVRTLYMDLVKAFHPDREPDEAEKQRKTEIMHRVTAAYEKSDLLALLQLQLEFEHIDQAHLESLAEDQLKYYNKILKQQADELDNEFFGLQNELAAMTGKPAFAVSSPIALEFSLNSDIAQLKRDIKHIKADLKALADTSQLKQWLKTYRIEKPDDFTFF
ncbi:J domain-containing protein [Spirosoma migulaei]